MYGIAAQKDIDEPKALADLKLAEHKVKEQIIDFVLAFNGGTAINPTSNKAICKQIENAAAKFSAKATEQKKPILREWLQYHIPFMLVLFLKLLK